MQCNNIIPPQWKVTSSNPSGGCIGHNIEHILPYNNIIEYFYKKKKKKVNIDTFIN